MYLSYTFALLSLLLAFVDFQDIGAQESIPNVKPYCRLKRIYKISDTLVLNKPNLQHIIVKYNTIYLNISFAELASNWKLNELDFFKKFSCRVKNVNVLWNQTKTYFSKGPMQNVHFSQMLLKIQTSQIYELKIPAQFHSTNIK